MIGGFFLVVFSCRVGLGLGVRVDLICKMEFRLNQVDYTKYSLSELHEALEGIDAKAFPQNYKNLLAELDKPERNNEKVLIAHKEQMEAERIILKRVLLIFAALMGFVASGFMYMEGVIRSRGGGEIVNVSDNPIAFHLGILAFLCFSIYSIYMGVFGDLRAKNTN